MQPADAEPFHRRAKAAVDSIPETLDGGRWVSQTEDVPPSATQLLRPNAVLSRRYVKQTADGRQLDANVLIVQCKDARDMQGHYPPRCYPANGDTLLERKPRTWVVDGVSIPGIEYLFSQTVAGRNDDRRVYNFFIIPKIPGMPDRAVRGICPDIDAIYKSGEDYQQRYYGAAEFQFVFSNDFSEQDRDLMLAELLGPNMNVVRTLMNDGPTTGQTGVTTGQPAVARGPAPAAAQASPAQTGFSLDTADATTPGGTSRDQ